MSRAESLTPPPHPPVRSERGDGGFGSVAPLGPWRARRATRMALKTPVAAAAVTSVLGIVGAGLAASRHPKVALAVFAALVAGVGILLEPGLGVLAYYWLAFARPHETTWGLGDQRFTLIVSLFTLGATVLHFALRPSFAFLQKKQTLFLVLLWAWLHISAHMNIFGSQQAKWLDYYNKIFLIYFVMLALLNSERWLYALGWVVAVSIASLAIWANQQYFINGWHTVHGPGRKGATYYDENGFAMILVMAVPFLWNLMLHVRRRYVQAALLGLIVLTAHAVMVTFSRGGFLGLSMAMGVLLFRLKNRGTAVLVALLGVAGFVAVTGPRYTARMLTITEYQQDDSASGRLDAWQAGIRMMKKRPIFGIGLKRFVEEFPHYSQKKPHEAHNSWVQIGAECGLPALSAHIMLVLLTAGSVLRIRRRLPYLPEESRRVSERLTGAYEAALVGYCVTGFFLSMEDFEFFYLLVGMTQILDRVTEQRVLEGAAAAAAAQPVPSPA